MKHNIVIKLNGKWSKIGTINLTDKPYLTVTETQIELLLNAIRSQELIGKELYGKTYYFLPIFEEKPFIVNNNNHSTISNSTDNTRGLPF